MSSKLRLTVVAVTLAHACAWIDSDYPQGYETRNNVLWPVESRAECTQAQGIISREDCLAIFEGDRSKRYGGEREDHQAPAGCFTDSDTYYWNTHANPTYSDLSKDHACHCPLTHVYKNGVCMHPANRRSFRPEDDEGYPFKLEREGFMTTKDVQFCPDEQRSLTRDECQALTTAEGATVTIFEEQTDSYSYPPGCYFKPADHRLGTDEPRYVYNHMDTTSGYFGYFESDGAYYGYGVRAVCKCPKDAPYDSVSGFCGMPYNKKVYSYPFVNSRYESCQWFGALSREECEATAALVEGATFTEVNSDTDYYLGCSKLRDGNNYFFNAATSTTYDSYGQTNPIDKMCHCGEADSQYLPDHGICKCYDHVGGEKHHTVAGTCEAMSQADLLARSTCGYIYTAEDHDAGLTRQFDVYTRSRKNSCD